MAVLSIQSGVALGHVGNAVAVPALQALGREVWRIDTVAFSNHPGHGRFTGGARPAAEIGGLVDGIAALGAMPRCAAVLSGYLGEPAAAARVARAVRRARDANPAAIYVLDPVIGDNGRVYVREGVMEAIRDELAPLADIAVPNLDELGWLTGRAVTGAAEMLEAARALRRLGPRSVAVTGRAEGGETAAYAIGAAGAWRAAAPRRARRFNGAGDLFAALLAGRLLDTGDLAAALGGAVAGADLVLAETERRGLEELAIVPALPSLAAVCAAAPPARRIG